VGSASDPWGLASDPSYFNILVNFVEDKYLILAYKNNFRMLCSKITLPDVMYQDVLYFGRFVDTRRFVAGNLVAARFLNRSFCGLTFHGRTFSGRTNLEQIALWPDVSWPDV